MLKGGDLDFKYFLTTSKPLNIFRNQWKFSITSMRHFGYDEFAALDSNAMAMSADALLLARLRSQQLDHQLLLARHRFKGVSGPRLVARRIHHHVVQNAVGRHRLDVERVVRDAQRGWGGKELDLKFYKLKNEFLFTKDVRSY